MKFWSKGCTKFLSSKMYSKIVVLKLVWNFGQKFGQKCLTKHQSNISFVQNLVKTDLKNVVGLFVYKVGPDFVQIFLFKNSSNILVRKLVKILVKNFCPKIGLECWSRNWTKILGKKFVHNLVHNVGQEICQKNGLKKSSKNLLSKI